MVNAMLTRSKLPNNLWGEALFAACHICNRILSKKLKVSPYELWKERKPNIGYFKV
jgi:lambda repressor-like predicted transcriptional regulator